MKWDEMTRYEQVELIALDRFVTEKQNSTSRRNDPRTAHMSMAQKRAEFQRRLQAMEGGE